MSSRLPEPGRRTRWLIIVYAFAVFFWLGPEDASALPVALLGTGGAVLLVVYWTMRRLGGQVIPPRLLIPLGGLLGALSGLLGALFMGVLMFAKNAWHMHPFPDFPTEMIGAALLRAPAWMLAGFLAGAGLALLWRALRGVRSDSDDDATSDLT